MQFRELSYPEADALITGWHDDPAITPTSPGIKLCPNCGGTLEVIDAVSGNQIRPGHWESVAGLLCKCTNCNRRYYAARRSSVTVD